MRKRLRDGTTREYHYAWRGGPRLPEPDDQRAYLIAYAEALKARVEPVRRRPDTLQNVIALYRQSDAYARLSPASKAFYARRLGQIEDAFGTLPVEALSARGMRAEIRAWHHAIPATREADTRLQVLSALLSWAVEHDHAPANPVAKMRRRHVRVDHSDVVWSPDELKALFEASSPDARRAFVVAAYTGLRLGDLVGLTWRDVDLEHKLIERATNKSRGAQRAYIPLLTPVRLALDECDPTTSTVLTNAWRKPWTEAGLQTAFHRARSVCGVNKRLHDLRGTAATMFARSGISAPEIARIMGWKEARVEEIVRRYVSRREIAAAIVRKIEG